MEWIGRAVAVLFVLVLLFFLAVIVRFSIISEIKTRGSKGRLRKPDSRGIRDLCGFDPPVELEDFFRHSPIVDQFEFELVDRTQTPTVSWPIGAFYPLTRGDVRERRRITGVPGIPIANDMEKGVYYVTSSGAVRLAHARGEGEDELVAPSVTAFAGFAKREIEVGED